MSAKWFKRMEVFRNGVDVYPVLSPEFCAGRPLMEIAEAVLDAGAKIIQLRMKNASKTEITETARRLVAETAPRGALLIINDHLDVALDVGADGVHLGLSDAPIAEAAETAPDLIIGASSHSLEEALAAETAGASYVNIGPIYATATKQVSTPPLGVDTLVKIAPGLKIPFTIMGGIKLRHIPELVAAGADRIAMVTEITQAEDVAARTRVIREAIADAKKQENILPNGITEHDH